jgi:hypothetical protein
MSKENMCLTARVLAMVLLIAYETYNKKKVSKC